MACWRSRLRLDDVGGELGVLEAQEDGVGERLVDGFGL